MQNAFAVNQVFFRKEFFAAHAVKTFVFLFINISGFIAQFPKFLSRSYMTRARSPNKIISREIKNFFQIYKLLRIMIHIILDISSFFHARFPNLLPVLVRTGTEKNFSTQKS